MIFIDTNFFLRFLLQDIKDQYIEAKAVFKKGARNEETLITSTVVIFEVFWVLNSSYEYNRLQLSKAIKAILDMTFIRLEERFTLQESLRLYDVTNLSLGDCYNLVFAREQQATDFKTFDIKLNKEFEKIVGSKKS